MGTEGMGNRCGDQVIDVMEGRTRLLQCRRGLHAWMSSFLRQCIDQDNKKQWWLLGRLYLGARILWSLRCVQQCHIYAYMLSLSDSLWCDWAHFIQISLTWGQDLSQTKWPTWMSPGERWSAQSCQGQETLERPHCKVLSHRGEKWWRKTYAAWFS